MKILSKIEDTYTTVTTNVPAARIDEDVFLLAHTLDETRSNSLKAMAFFYSEYGGYERPLDVYKKKVNVESYLDIPEDILREYAIMDAIVTHRVFTNMYKHLLLLDAKYPNEKYPENSIEKYYHYRRIPAANMYAKMEYRGVYVNKKKLDALREQMEDYIKGLGKKLSEAFGVSENFNWGSSDKVGELLQSRGWEDYGRTESGKYLVSKPQFDRWKKNHPEAITLREYGSATTLIDSFVGDREGTKGWSQYLIHHDEDPEDVWRMHPDYSPLGTESGRTRCSKPNMQNVPTRGKFTKEIKQCLCTPNDDEYYMVTVDYSSLQMRLAAIDCQDPNLTKALSSPDADVHSMTAYLTFSQDKEYDVETVIVEDENGTHTFLGGQKVITKNRGEVFARDLQEDDELL